MERKLKPITVQQAFKDKELRLFTPVEFQRFFAVSLRAAQEFIKDHSHDLFLKMRKGCTRCALTCHPMGRPPTGFIPPSHNTPGFSPGMGKRRDSAPRGAGRKEPRALAAGAP